MATLVQHLRAKISVLERVKKRPLSPAASKLLERELAQHRHLLSKAQERAA